MELDPNDHRAWNQKGVALRSMGRYNEAIECFNKSLELVPKDLDVLDPAFAPGVGNPEALGMTSRELFDMIYYMEEKSIPCMDIVELCPPYDNGATASIAAKLIAEVIAMTVSS